MEDSQAVVDSFKVHLTRFSGVFAPHYKYRAMVVLKTKALKAVTTEAHSTPVPSPSRIGWARLLKRVFNIDVNICALCRGQMKIIAAIGDPHVIKKILAHLGLPTQAPTAFPARGPPLGFDNHHQQLPDYDLL